MGLTGALGFLSRGFVLVGNVPSTDGTSATVQQGNLLVLDRNGKLVATWTDKTFLNGPWGLAVHEDGTGAMAQVFVSTVFSGTVVRFNVRITGANITIESVTQIGSDYLHRTDPAALVVGPQGLAYDARYDILFVASTADNAIYAIHDASRRGNDASGTGQLIYKDNAHLHGPLGLVLVPDGHLLTSNGDAVNPDPAHQNELVEFTRSGRFVAQFSIDPGNAGAAFGIALQTTSLGTTLAAVDDNLNAVDILDFLR